MDSSSGKTLYLIDGHAQFFRAYHAIRPGTMSSPVTKEPTNLTYGFAGMMIKLFRDYHPDYVAVIIDVSGDRESFRSELYSDYKANREAAPDDFHPQVNRCLEVLGDMRVPVIGLAGVEADDVIATIVQELRGAHPDLNIRVVTKDKDLTQLCSDHVELFDVHKDESVTPEKVFKTDGVTPHMVRDILALMGDNVDNIPGVPGIGPKTAAALIIQYGSIENLYEHIDEIKGKRRENLEASREVVKLSRQLVDLKRDCEIEFDLDEAVYGPDQLNVEQLRDRFRELGFGRYQEEIARLAGGGESASPATKTAATRAAAPIGESLFAQVSNEAAIENDGHYEMVATTDGLRSVVKSIRKTGFCAIDTETDGLSSVSANLCGVSVAIRPGEAWYIPTRSPDPKSHLDTAAVIETLRPVLEDAGIPKIGHNIKFDLNILRSHGVRLANVSFDTMIASYVIDASRSSHSMDALSLAFLNHSTIRLTDLIGTGKNQKTFDQVPLEHAVPYAAEDADITLRLRNVLDPKLDAEGLRTLFADLEMPLVEVLAELEFNGIRVDPDELDRQREAILKRVGTLRQLIIDSAPHAFSPDSPKQLSAVLFNKITDEPPGLGLKVIKRGKTGPSTDQEVLEKLASDPDLDSQIPQLIVEYRQLTKLVNTYLIALKDAINPRTRRVHASFNQTVAATGRLSSSDPNLQNIPIRTDIGREIRRAFVAEPGHMLITADYSQIELRILAHLSDDPALIDAFQRDADIHTTVAAEVYGVAPDEVTAEQRNSAKMINFGIVYGITPFGLSRRLGQRVSVEEAATIIADYKHRFSRINEFLESCAAHAEQHGYVATMMGRRRDIPQIHSSNPQETALGRRMAINSVVQGSAADLIKLAMIDLHRRMPAQSPRTRMLLQIHDELVFESPEEEAPSVRAFVVERMEKAMHLNVPLRVGSAVAANWIDAK